MTARRIRTAREMIIFALHKGEENSEIVARVKKSHPRSPTTAATVNYIRNEIRKQDKSLKSNRAIRASR